MKNSRGLSLIELLAVIIVVSVVIMPLMFSLSGNFRVNYRMINRSAASLISASAVQGFDTIPFDDLSSNDSFDVATSYHMFNRDNCGLLVDETAFQTSEAICTMIFDMKMIERTFTNPEHFEVYLYPYFLTDAAEKTAFIDAAIADGLDARITDAMEERIEIIDTEYPLDLLNITVFILYDTETDGAIVRNGTLTEDWVE